MKFFRTSKNQHQHRSRSVLERTKKKITDMAKVREIPTLYKRKEECCGCTACYAICPKNAISMVVDEEGFEYPKIDESKCIACYQCIRVCPIKAAR